MAPRIGFVTCVQLGLSCIEAIHAAGGRFNMFMTLRDDIAQGKSGRVYLDSVAARTSTPLEKIRHINDPEATELLRSYDLDWLFVIGWSQILTSEALHSAKEGVLGMHPTLLPQGRGRAAIPWAIIRGLSRTGVTLFKLDGGVDTGPIVDQVEVPIAGNDDATSLYRKVSEAHEGLMLKVWPRVQSGEVPLREQDDALSSFWPGRTPADGVITKDLSLEQVDRLVRATTRPYPGAFVVLEDGSPLRVWAGSAGQYAPGAYPITVSDGIYYATEFDRGS